MSNNLNDLEMAKKRDHKIMITDEAINKVPRVQYKEISETQMFLMFIQNMTNDEQSSIFNSKIKQYHFIFALYAFSNFSK